MKNQSSKNTRNMATKSVPKHMQSTISALTDFVIGIYLEVSPNDSDAKIRQAMLDHQDKLIKILKDNLTVQKQQTLKKFKDPDAPKRGKSSYIYFCVEKREEIKNANPDMSAKDIIKELGRVWREDTSDKDKAIYSKMSADDKLRYEDEMKDYTPDPNDVSVIAKTKRSGPKRGLSAYIFFCNDQREILKEENPDLPTKEVTSELGKRWRELSEKGREPYNKLAATDKSRYEKEKVSWVDPKSDDNAHVFEKEKGKASKKDTPKKGKASKKDAPKKGKGKESSIQKNIRRKSGYILYCQETRPTLKEVNEDMTSQQITKELGRAWKELSEEEQLEYNNRAANTSDEPNTKKDGKQKHQSDLEELVDEDSD